MFRKSLFAVGTVTLMVAGAVAGPAYADAPATEDNDSDAGWYAEFPATGDVFDPDQSDIWGSQAASSNEISPMLLDPASWTQCHLGNESWTVASQQYWWDGVQKDMKLKCGNEAYGWIHIRDGHMNQWKDRITQTGVPGVNTDPWDDLMWYAAQMSLVAEWNSSGPTNGKLCATTEIQMYRSDNQQRVYTFYPTFSWSLTNDRLITGYPSTNPDC